MGCMCSKGISTNEYAEKESKRSSKRFLGSSRRDEVAVEVDNGGNDAATTRLISEDNREHTASSRQTPWEQQKEEEEERKSVVYEQVQVQVKSQVQPLVQLSQNPIEAKGNGDIHIQQPEICRIYNVANGVDVTQEAAGWPSWLTAVAGEAIKGLLPRKADSFEKLDKIGQGTYSSVYRARDLESGKIVALKKVRFTKMDPESVRFMAREIIVLRRLDHPNVMKLEGLLTSRVSGNLYLVFDYMEHDLAGLAASPIIKFTEPQIKCYMQQLLCGLAHCHNRGILHRDIKGSNLLIDNNGNLKIGDFGLATIFSTTNHRQPLTSRVVTLWYRPPELLLGATDYGVAVDLWSAGCILAELFAGKPIMPGRTEVEQLHKIFKLCGSPSEEYWRKSKLPHATIFKPQQPYKRCVSETFKDFPPSALTLLDSLLAVEPHNRGSAFSALHSEFFTTKPLPCHPSSLPKYPPSKELDAKMWDDEMRRGKTRGVEPLRNGTRESRAQPAPNANAELQASIRKRLEQQNPKSSSEKFNNHEDDSGSAVSSQYGIYNNGRSKSKQPGGPEKLDEPQLGLDSAQHYKHRGAQLSKFSNSLAWHGSSRLDHSNGNSSHWAEEDRPNGLKYQQLNDPESSSSHHMGGPGCSYKKQEHAPGKGYAMKKNRIHYSGPLVPPGGNMDEMLKEHERQIQHAVRKARSDKSKNKKGHTDNGQRESLLQYGGSYR
ncbi:hypothetical protein LXL04_016980 [Taraxacum kok-saghyz]